MDRRVGAWAAAFAVLALPAPAAAAESVYVVRGLTAATVAQFGVSPLGGLTPLSPAEVSAGNGAGGIALAPDGRTAYVTATGAGVGPALVHVFAVGAMGTLTPAAPADPPAGEFPRSVAVAPDGASVYSANGNAVAQYDVGPGGALTLKTPASLAIPFIAVDVAVNPDGRSVYVVHRPDPALAGTISQFDVGTGGRLSPKTPPTVAAGTGASAIAVSPDGRSVYVANAGGDTVSQYDAAADGSLAPKTPATVASAGGPNAVAVSPDGLNVYVGNFGDTVSQYTVGPGGALAPKAPATVAAATTPNGIVVSPDSRRVYVATTNGPGTVRQFDVGPGGALTPMALPPVTAGVGVDVAISPRQGPVAAFSAGTSGLLAAFDGSASTSAARYDWDFGDGSAVRDGGPAPAHAYAAAGTYQVTLTVADEIGCSTTVVFTGRTASCNGGPAARRTLPVTVTLPQGGPPGANGRDRSLLAVALTARRYRSEAGRRLRVTFASTLAGRATLQARRGRRVVARSSRTIRAGAAAMTLRVRREGRYTLRLIVRAADGQRRTVTARLSVQ